MKRLTLTLVVVSGLLVLVGAALAPVSLSKTPGGSPLALPPPPKTQQCDNVAGCQGVSGPWVWVPAGEIATYLLRCPEKRGWLIGGTDARASSTDVRVWFDGQLGAPLGQPSNASSTGAALLFHAMTKSGKQGSFEPILGCVKLRKKGLRSTVSARVAQAAPLPGSPPSAPLDIHAVNVELSPPVTFVQHVSCLKTEKLVSSWHSVAFYTGPPDISHISELVRITSAIEGIQMAATVKTAAPLLFPLGAYPEIQVGVVCESRG